MVLKYNEKMQWCVVVQTLSIYMFQLSWSQNFTNNLLEYIKWKCKDFKIET